MPTIVSCVRCPQRYAIHESQAGQRVGCPTCRTPRVQKGDTQPQSGLKALVVSLFVGAAFLFACTATGVMWWVVVGPGSKRLAAGRDKAQDQAQPAEGGRARAATEPAPKRTVAEKPKTEPKLADPQPPPPEELNPRTFDEAWKAAEKKLDEQAALEPEMRATAMKLLTEKQIDEISPYLAILDRSQSDTFRTDLLHYMYKFNFHHTVYVTSAKLARKSEDFLDFARRVWYPEMYSWQLPDMASHWFCLDIRERSLVKLVVTEGIATRTLSRGTRAAFIELGCKKWLDDH